jgi:uncharacterized protein (DUF2141 family)
MDLKYFYLITIIFLLLLSSCANISAPTGGPKDTIPPKLLSTFPIHKSLNFKGKKVILEFDENIKIENIQNQLIIIPNPEGNYKSKIVKNIVELEFDKPFSENTTYTFNFRDAVKDITEGNKTLDVKLAFSTGEYIDSLSIEGEIKNLLNTKPVDKVVVGLYKATDTTDIFNEKPLYFTITNEEGRYKIENIKNGKYRIYAIKDKNNNLKADGEEAYGFKADTIDLNENKKIQIFTTALNNKHPKIQNSRPNGKYFELKFNKYIVDYDLKTGEKLLNSNLIEDNKTLRIYNTTKLSFKDSLKATIIYSDSLQQTKEEVIYIKFAESKKQKESFKADWTLKNSNAINKPLSIKLKFNKPVLEFFKDSLTIQYDSINIETASNLSEINWNKNKTEVTIDLILNKKLIENKEENKKRTVNLKAPKGTFISIEADTNEIFKKEIKILSEADYGTIKGKIETKYKSFIIQILSKNSEVIAEQKNKINYEFKTLEPGEYFIRILVDENEDGLWSPGNINKRIEPEKVILIKDPINLRASWEMEQKEISF